ncbi:MAG: NAD(P)/FAD-dependent oxidoreductase [Acidobacteria bacterium]|nr:NAD(P)/FAD-dependent oxidoreductase [Acidobacteriota bacterium]
MNGHPFVPQALPAPGVAVVGGGIMGISLAYVLARQGIAADVFEASPVLGGLAGPLVLDDGVEVDRFYHAILSSDGHLRALCTELGIESALRFKQTTSAFFLDDGLHSMNSLIEFLLFRPLSPYQRLRLGGTVALAQFYRDWQALEDVPVREWLVRLGGAGVFERLWEPMLDAKFDGQWERTRATWMWARLVRMRSTREGANQREQSGHLVGGYKTLLTAMARAIEGAGGRIHLRTPVDEVRIHQGRATGVVVRGADRPYAQVVVTMQGPVARRLLAGAPADYLARLDAIQYLGIVCPLMVLDRPLTGTWVVNIADRRVPLTGVIETTSYIDPALVGGHHLAYLPKYTAPGSGWQDRTDAEIREAWLAAVKRIVPAFEPSWIRQFLVHREHYVEPVHPLGGPPVPGLETPIPNLTLATTAQIYPALTNGESVTRHAAAAAACVAQRMGAARTAGAAA